MVSVGATIGGRYRCVQALPGWGFGDAWLVEDGAQQGVRCCLKLLPGGAMGAALDVYLTKWMALRARGTAAVLAAGVHEGRSYVVLEHGADETLASWLASMKTRRPTTAHALAVFDGVCAALEAAHRAPRDALPWSAHGALSSVCVALEMKFEAPVSVAVMDFGLVDLHSFGSYDAERRYAAPEVLEALRQGRGSLHEAATPRSDVFSLGVLLMELLTGNAVAHASSGVTWAQLGRDGQGHVAGRVRTLRPDLAPKVLEAAATALHPQPDGRYENAGILRTALRKAGLWDLVRGGHTSQIDDPHAQSAREVRAVRGEAKSAAPGMGVVARPSQGVDPVTLVDERLERLAGRAHDETTQLGGNTLPVNEEHTDEDAGNTVEENTEAEPMTVPTRRASERPETVGVEDAGDAFAAFGAIPASGPEGTWVSVGGQRHGAAQTDPTDPLPVGELGGGVTRVEGTSPGAQAEQRRWMAKETMTPQANRPGVPSWVWFAVGIAATLVVGVGTLVWKT